jgi:hypothetical protein
VQDIELEFAKWDEEAAKKDVKWLENALSEWLVWSRLRLYAPNRGMYLEIIKYLKKELENAKREVDTYCTRTVGFRLGGNKTKNGNSGDADNFNADFKRKDMGVAQKRVYCLGGKNKPGQE